MTVPFPPVMVAGCQLQARFGGHDGLDVYCP